MEKIKNYFKWAGWPLFFIALFFKCGPDSQMVTIPAKHGSFAAVEKPKPLQPKEKPAVIKWRKIEIPVLNPVDAELAEKYQQAQDSISRYKLYLDAIGVREYSIIQEDSLLQTTNHIKARGEVISFQQDYIIKPQKVAVKPKEVAFRMFAGLEVGNTKEFDNFSAKANVMFQNKKGNIFSAGYDTERRIWVGGAFSIFSVKK